MADNCIIVVTDLERMATTYLMFTRSSLSGVVVMVMVSFNNSSSIPSHFKNGSLTA